MGIQQDIKRESLRSLPVREPLLVPTGTIIREAVEAMRHRQLGCVVVTHQDRRPLGQFTECGLISLLVEQPEAINAPVREHMFDWWASLHQDEPIRRVVSQIHERGLRFIIVLDDHGRAVGLTGQKGLVEYIAEHFAGLVMNQRLSPKPFIHEREGA